MVGGRAERGAHLDDGLDELGATRGVALAVEALAGVEALAVAVVHGLGRGGTVAFGAIVEGKAGQRAAVGLGELAKRRASLGGGVGRRGVLAQERARELHAEAAGELERARGNECGRRRGRGRQRIRTREREARRLRGLARLPPRLAPALGLGADFGRGVGRDPGGADSGADSGGGPQRPRRRSRRSSIDGSDASIVDGRARPEVWEVGAKAGIREIRSTGCANRHNP